MKKSPNAFHKFLHRFLMLRPVSAVLSAVLHHTDNLVIKLTKGKHTATALVGLPVVHLTTVGAKTGEPRIMPLVGILDGEKIALIGSNFGREHNPGWYYNLKANPRCAALVNGRQQTYIAREVHDEEREKYWTLAISYYKGYELYAVRAAHRRIPVMILEPAK